MAVLVGLRLRTLTRTARTRSRPSYRFRYNNIARIERSDQRRLGVMRDWVEGRATMGGKAWQDAVASATKRA